MYFLETCHIPEITGTLVVQRDQAYIQQIMDDEITIREWVIPVLHHEKEEELYIVIDEHILELFKKYTFVRITSEYLNFGEVSYRYDHGDVLSWETQLPKLVCIMKVPELHELHSEYCTCIVDRKYFNIECGKTLHHYNTIQIFERAKANFQSTLLSSIFHENRGKVCKVYLEDDFPICLEFSYPVQRYFIAPCVDTMSSGKVNATCAKTQ